MHSCKYMTGIGWLVSIWLLVAIAAQAKPISYAITLKEQLNQTYGPELLSYPFTAKNGACVADGVRLTGPNGPKAVQLSDIEYWPGKQKYAKSARLVFVAEALKPLTAANYTVTYDSKPAPALDAGLQIKRDKSNVEIATGQVGIRLPLGGGTNATPVPGPLTAMRLGNGAWVGGSAFTGDDAMKAWSAELIDAGPVLARVRMTYTFADGNTLALTAAVAAGDNAVHWDLQTSGDRPDLGVTFRLPPVPGVKQVVFPRGYGQWANALAPTGMRILPLTPGEKPFCFLSPDSSLVNTFPENAVNIVLAAGEDGPQLQIRSYEPGLWVAPVAPLTYGGFKLWHADMITKSWDNWRRLQMPVSYAADGTVSLQAAFTKGRRLWSISAGAPTVGRTLDRIKEQVFDWPADPKKAHPRLFMSAPEIQAAWKRGPISGSVQAWAWGALGAPAAVGLPLKPAEQQTAAEKTQAVGYLRGQLAYLGNFDVMRGAIGVAGLYDALIDSDLVTPAERTLFRAQMARLAYVMADPQCWSIERGYHSGNPNMSSSYTLSLGIIACALADHPMAKTWADYAASWVDKWLTDDVGPNGEWICEGSHYGAASLEPIVAFAIAAKRAGFRDFTNDPRLKKLLLYYAKTQTPPDPRYGNARGSGAWGRGTSADRLCIFAMAAFMTAQSDPAFSKTMQWMWAAQGYPAPGADWRMGGYENYAFDRNLPAQAPPAWGSELYPNLGVFFRTAYNTPEESYLIFLSHTDDLRNFDVWTPGIGSFSQWFSHGKPISTCFNLDTGYFVRHELLRDGVRLARNWGAPGDSKAPFGYYATTTPQAVALQPAADYARSSFSYTKADDRDWFPNPVPPAYPRVTPATEPKLDWTRQVLYLKDADPAGPTYLVVRDTTRGGQPTAWQFWTLSEKIGTPEQTRDLNAFLADKPGTKLLPARELPAGNRYTAVGQFGVDVEYFIASPAATPRHTLRYGGQYNGVPEYQDLLHLQQPGGGVYYLAIFPHPRTEAAPEFTALADGKIIKAAGAFGADYAFLASEATTAAADGLTVNGTSATVQQRGQNTVLTLGAAGELRYKDYGLNAAMSASLQVTPAALTVTVPSDSAGGQLTLTAPVGWSVKSPAAGVKVEAKDGTYLLTIPKGVTQVVFSRNR